MTAQYTAEKWTDVLKGHKREELWAVMMPNGQPCAYGSREWCEQAAKAYTQQYAPKVSPEPPRCENSITEPWDTTGEFAQACNAPATLRGDVYLCDECASSAKEKAISEVLAENVGAKTEGVKHS